LRAKANQSQVEQVNEKRLVIIVVETIAAVIALLRPKQWIKNLLLFAGLIFSSNLFQLSLLYSSIVAFISFCLLSSCVYIINDIVDIEADKRHSKKQNRPLAAGKVSIRQAVVVFIGLFTLSLFGAWSINTSLLFIGILYFVLVSSYSYWLKNIVILDVFAVAFGFLLRAVAGGVAINVKISPWFLLCTLLISLFLALTKRRQESIILEDNGITHRKVLEHYPLSYLDQLISIVTAATILAYSLYTFTASQSEYFMLTIPFVIYGIFRYLYLVHNKELGESTEEILLKDKPLLINVLIWVLLSISLLYFEQGGMF